ncbi:MAG: FecR domain-containing protein, partial [Anaerohalosphaera sp.]|nr:FecR domain-containing protein [Anaerohalosphaera sp.]
MTSPRQYNRISELLALLVENAITKDQLAELDNAVVGNSDAEEYCVEWLMNYDSLQRFGSVFFQSANEVENAIIRDFLPTHYDDESNGFDTALWEALGQNELTAEPVEVEPEPILARPVEMVPALPTEPRKISKFSLYTFAVSAAALLFIAVIALLTSPPLPFVASLGDSINASWSGSAGRIENGQLEYGAELRPGDLALVSGVAKIIMVDGAEVVLKGPVAIELETTGRLKLTHGKLYANVPKGSEGFTVSTNSATVVDYGTEFGVEVDRLGRTEAHVFQGMVKLAAGTNDSLPADAVELTAGQAGSVEDGGIKQVAFRRHAFTSYVPTAYELAVKEKRPMTYWRLKPGSAQSLISLADRSSVEVQYNGLVDLVDGPFPGHSDVCSAVKFYGDKSHLFIPQVEDRRARSDNGGKRKYTFMLWVRPDANTNQVISSRTNQGGQFHRVVGMTEDG